MNVSRLRTALVAAAPGIFVVLWASGFVVARIVRPYADAESFVSLRFALSAAMLAGLAAIAGARWPRSARSWGENLVTGMLMQGAYVGGVFWAVGHGLPAALASLIAGLQPLLTSALAWPLLGEKVGARRWLGVGLGFCGAVLVIGPQLAPTHGAPAVGATVACTLAMVAMTLGTIWQKRTGGSVDLRAGAAVQCVGGLLITLPIALATDHRGITNNLDVWIALAWGVIVLSVVTALLLLTLIRNGAIAQVTSLFYLVPPITALMALVLFGEALVPAQIVGMAIAAIGVFIARKS